MEIEVDQSGKIEQTNLDTALAFSDAKGSQRTIIIKAKEKRLLITSLRAVGKRGTWFYPRIYAAGLYVLLKPTLKKVSKIWIDDEYTGKRKIIKSLLLQFAKKDGIKLEWDQIDFKLVTRYSEAHKLAIGVLRGKIKQDRKVSAEEILRILGK